MVVAAVCLLTHRMTERLNAESTAAGAQPLPRANAANTDGASLSFAAAS